MSRCIRCLPIQTADWPAEFISTMVLLLGHVALETGRTSKHDPRFRQRVVDYTTSLFRGHKTDMVEANARACPRVETCCTSGVSPTS